ncbi:MAG: gluconokinase [Paracoccaceae bacterium]
MHCFVIMGVSGCGKTTVGTALAKTEGLSFIDGDNLHPAENIQKMAQGNALDDDDRAPWLADIGRALANTSDPVVIGCSALKRKYRDLIRNSAGKSVHFLHLDAPRHVIAERLNDRSGHFMPPSLLDSQFQALEGLSSDELGKQIDISRSFDDVLDQCRLYIQEVIK